MAKSILTSPNNRVISCLLRFIHQSPHFLPQDVVNLEPGVDRRSGICYPISDNCNWIERIWIVLLKGISWRFPSPSGRCNPDPCLRNSFQETIGGCGSFKIVYKIGEPEPGFSNCVADLKMKTYKNSGRRNRLKIESSGSDHTRAVLASVHHDPTFSQCPRSRNPEKRKQRIGIVKIEAEGINDRALRIERQVHANGDRIMAYSFYHFRRTHVVLA